MSQAARDVPYWPAPASRAEPRATGARATPGAPGEDPGSPCAGKDGGTRPDPALGGPFYNVRAAVAAERARIVRELHDCVGKSLFGIAITAASLATPRLRSDPQLLDQRLRELEKLAREAVSTAHDILNDLREDALGDAVRTLAAGWGVGAGVRVSLTVSPGDETTPQIRGEVISMLRELLDNVERHARASRARVSLRRAPERLLLTVTDNGAGFRPPADLTRLRSGLARAEERARRAGGTLTIRSRPGRGTRVAISLPVPPSGKQRLRPVLAAQPSPAVRVVIADENPALRYGLRAALEHQPGVEVVADVADGSGVTDQVRRQRPDVLLLDARLPLEDGLATISQLSRIAQVVMLAGVDDAALVGRALTAGAHGYLVHGEFEPGELVRKVVDTAKQEPHGAPHALDGRADRSGNGNDQVRPYAGGKLTPREREVMRLIAEGLSNRQIAARLVISEKTVKNHICSIYQRFGVYERSQAVRRWREL
jgi:DNA-binding NarL/FixJ family response regulator